MNTLVLGGIFFGVSATAFFAFFSFWGTRQSPRDGAGVTALADQLDRAGIRMKLAGNRADVSRPASRSLWFLLRLPVEAAAAASAAGSRCRWSPVPAPSASTPWVKFKIQRRLDAFVDAARARDAAYCQQRPRRIGPATGAGDRGRRAARPRAARVPAGHRPGEHSGRASSTRSTRWQSACRVTNPMMVARVFRVQAETGGDLAQHSRSAGGAASIKGRRQVQRKISTLTAEGRMSAWVLMLIPIGLGAFIFATQPEMSHALFFTFLGAHRADRHLRLRDSGLLLGEAHPGGWTSDGSLAGLFHPGLLRRLGLPVRALADPIEEHAGRAARRPQDARRENARGELAAGRPSVQGRATRVAGTPPHRGRLVYDDARGIRAAGGGLRRAWTGVHPAHLADRKPGHRVADSDPRDADGLRSIPPPS